MEEKQERKQTLRQRTTHALGLPSESLGGVPSLELLGDRDLYLTGYGGILSYSREEICIDGGKWVLRLTGQDLEIKAMGAGELRLFGIVHRMELV